MARTAGRQGFVSFVPIVATSRTSVAEDTEANPDTAEPGSEPANTENR